MIPLILHVTRLVRFAREFWRETQHLRRKYPGLAGE